MGNRRARGSEMEPFDTIYRRSLEEPEAFWAEAAAAIHWDRTWDLVLDDRNPPFYRWFSGGRVNTCYNALDLHVETGRGEQPALIYDSPVTGTLETFSYRRLRDDTACFAGVLAAHGASRGDRVVIYMPMVPQAVVAMLACARLGVVHSVVFGGFAANELAVRIDDATPKLIVSASCGIEPSRIVEYKPLLEQAIGLARHKPDRCIILQREQHRCELDPALDVDWTDAMESARPHDCVSVAATDPLYILYTSGTTGRPKGVVRDHGGHAVALKWSMKNIYGVEPGETYWAASDLGWAVGHSYIVYGPLLHGNTTVLYEGKPVGTPDAGAFWRVISQHQVRTFFTAPTAFRAIKRQDPEGNLLADYDLSRLRTLFLAGERTDPDTLRWARDKLGVPVVDHWWQTETGWSICVNCMGIQSPQKGADGATGQPFKDGSVTRPAPGWDVRVVDSANRELAAGEIGALVVKLPLPPGSLPTLWNDDQRFVESYFREFPGYYKTADAGIIDDDDYVFVMARTDDIINVAGHRLSTCAMEEVLAEHPDVAECAVIGAADPLKGQLPVGFLVLNAGVDRDRSEIVREVIQQVRERIGPVAAFKNAVVVDRLPKTRSGKVLRGTMRRIADGEPYPMPATIEEPVVLDEISEALGTLGYPRRD